MSYHQFDNKQAAEEFAGKKYAEGNWVRIVPNAKGYRVLVSYSV